MEHVHLMCPVILCSPIVFSWIRSTSSHLLFVYNGCHRLTDAKLFLFSFSISLYLYFPLFCQMVDMKHLFAVLFKENQDSVLFAASTAVLTR